MQQMRKLLVVGMILLTATVGFAQSTKLKGRVMDTSGGIMPGAHVKVLQGEKVIAEGDAGSTGDFEIPLNPGNYKVQVTFPDFDTFNQDVRFAANTPSLQVKMTIGAITTVVDVTETATGVSVDSDSSLSTTTLTGDAIADLPDDETELAAYLQQIAGTRGGAGGQGNFVIDGFSGGRLPPKDQIQEIRINNNPYSTEFSGIGFGRMEIITRAGSGNFSGNFNYNMRDDALNAKNPFLGDKPKPPFHSDTFNMNYGGPIIRGKLSANFGANRMAQENTGTINAFIPDGTPTGKSFNDSVLSPSDNRGFNTRGQYAITRNNSLNFNYNYRSNSNKNQGAGGITLAERTSDRKSSNFDFQVRETAIIGTSMVHEIRFSTGRDTSDQHPKTVGMAINVLDQFNSGGGQNKSNSRDWSYEGGNLFIFSKGRWQTKAGLQLTHETNHQVTENNFIGTYTFSSMTDYLAGKPLQFSKNTGNPLLNSEQTEFGSFWQNDFKFSPKFTLSAGLRYESQTNLNDFNNLDPRVGLALGLTKTSVLRAGAGVFHQRLGIGNVQSLLQLDGTRQLQIVIRNPLFPDPGIGSVTPPSSIRVRAADLEAPYSINTSLSIEKSFPKGLGMVYSWDTTRGLHQLRSRNLNAPFTANAPRPIPTQGNINQLESTGMSRSNNFNIQFSENLPSISRITQLRLNGGLGFGWSKSDSDGAFGLPMDNYNLWKDWGRSSQDTRRRFNAGLSFRTPLNMFMSTNINATSGRPYNITTGRDDNGDTNINDRPAGFDKNAGTGPKTYSMSMNLNKTIPLHREARAGGTPGGNAVSPFMESYAEPQRGGGGGGGFPGGGGARGGDGGGRGDGGPRLGNRGGPDGGRGRGQMPNKTMTISAQINNLLNNTQLQNISGVQTSASFGKARSAANGRSINLGIRFNF